MNQEIKKLRDLGEKIKATIGLDTYPQGFVWKKTPLPTRGKYSPSTGTTRG